MESIKQVISRGKGQDPKAPEKEFLIEVIFGIVLRADSITKEMIGEILDLLGLEITTMTRNTDDQDEENGFQKLENSQN